MASPASAGALRRLLGEIAASGEHEHVLAVGGAAELAPLLRQQLLRGRGEPGAVRLGDPEGAAVYVHVLSADPRAEDEEVLRRARRARVPAIVIAAGCAAGFGIRAVAREALGLVTGAGWRVKAGVAYTGTRAVGEAARMRFAGASTRQPDGVARASF